MQRLGIVGTSIHRAPVDLLSALTLPREQRQETLKALAERCGFEELVYIATCNRVEFVFQQREERPLRSARNRILDHFFSERADVSFQPENFYLLGGDEAARHLFSVAASLDSLVIGEAQILGQVKEAFAESRSVGLVGGELQRLFQSAFHVGKKVRRGTDIGARKVSIVNLARECLAELVTSNPDVRVALVGSGEMTGKLAEALKGLGVKDLLFVNRTLAKAEPFADRWKGRAMSLADFLADPPRVDAVCTATAAPKAIFGRDEAERLMDAGAEARPFLFLDLAIPRDVSDEVACLAGVRLCHLGTLREMAQDNRRDRFRAADQAREIIDEEVERYHQHAMESALSPLVGDTQKLAREFAESGLETLLEGRLAHLSDEDKKAVRYWVLTKLVPNVLRLPVQSIARSADQEQVRGGGGAGGGVKVQGLRLAPPKC